MSLNATKTNLFYRVIFTNITGSRILTLSGFVVGEVFKKKLFFRLANDLRISVSEKSYQKVVASVCVSMTAMKSRENEDFAFGVI